MEQALIQDDTHVIHIEDIDYIQKIIHKMLSLQHFNFSDELQHQAMLLEIFSKLINERNKTQQCRDLVPINSHVEDALQYISANYMNNISIADIAHFVKLSNAHLNSCFKNHLNTTPQQYLTRYRIEKACQLILNTNSSITDISQQVGYSDSLTFSKAFKKLLGTSPSIWRSNT